jgi:hypothetical protein
MSSGGWSRAHRRPWGFVVLALLGAGEPARAAGPEPRPFALTWTSQLLAAGQHDFEAWVSPRIARTDDSLVLTDTRAAIATGLGSRLEALFGLDLDFTANRSSTSVEPRATTLWRWAPLDADGPLGAGGLLRGSLGFDSAELEARLFADKRVGALWLAVNASASRRFFWNGGSGVDTHLEETAGLRYAVGPSASFGLEGEVRSGFLRGAYRGTAVYVGPSFTFRVSRVWVTLGALAQVAADKAPEDKGDGQPLELEDNERFVGRVVIGYQE